jgi:hypothetical protein
MMQATAPQLCDLDAERAVVGAVLLEGNAALRKLVGLHTEVFYTEGHRAIFRAALALHGRGEALDVLTVRVELERAHELDVAGGPAALALLLEHAAITPNLPSYAAIICEHAQRREYNALGQRLASANGAGPAELAAMVRDAELLVRAVAPPVLEPIPSEATAFLGYRFPVRADIVARGVLTRGGFLIINGRPKMGKSVLCDNLDIQRVRGGPWLGFATDPGVTLAIQAELSPESWQKRIRAMLANDPEPIPPGRLYLRTLRGLYLNTPEGLDRVHRLLDETGADCLRLDPLARHMVGNENSNGADGMGGVVRAVDAILARGVAVVLVHHQAKPVKDEPRTGGLSLRGGSALYAAADSIITVERDGDAVLLSFELRHGPAPDPIRLAMTDDLWFVPIGADPELLKVAELTIDSPLPYTTLRKAAEHDLQLSERTAKRRIADAIKAGVLEKDADGLYRMGPRGHAGPRDA